jgi:hypothetical protein
MTPVLARTLRSGTLHDFETAARQELADATISQRVVQLVLEGKTTVTEAMKIAGWDEG